MPPKPRDHATSLETNKKAANPPSHDKAPVPTQQLKKKKIANCRLEEIAPIINPNVEDERDEIGSGETSFKLAKVKNLRKASA